MEVLIWAVLQGPGVDTSRPLTATFGGVRNESGRCQGVSWAPWPPRTMWWWPALSRGGICALSITGRMLGVWWVSRGMPRRLLRLRHGPSPWGSIRLTCVAGVVAMIAAVAAPASGDLLLTNHRHWHCSDWRSGSCRFTYDWALKPVNALWALHTSLRQVLAGMITWGRRRVLIVCLWHVHCLINFLLSVDGEIRVILYAGDQFFVQVRHRAVAGGCTGGRRHRVGAVISGDNQGLDGDLMLRPRHRDLLSWGYNSPQQHIITLTSSGSSNTENWNVFGLGALLDGCVFRAPVDIDTVGKVIGVITPTTSRVKRVITKSCMLRGRTHSSGGRFTIDTVWVRWTVGGVRGVCLCPSQELVDEQVCIHVPHIFRCSLATARHPPRSAARCAHATSFGVDGAGAGTSDRALTGQRWGVHVGGGDGGFQLDWWGRLCWSLGIVIDVMAESKVIQEVKEASLDALELPL